MDPKLVYFELLVEKEIPKLTKRHPRLTMNTKYLRSVQVSVFVNLKLYESILHPLSHFAEIHVELHTVEAEHTERDCDTEQGDLVFQVGEAADFLEEINCVIQWKWSMTNNMLHVTKWWQTLYCEIRQR